MIIFLRSLHLGHQFMILNPYFSCITKWNFHVIFCLLVPPTSHGKLVSWRMPYEVEYFTRLPWEKRLNAIMMIRKHNGPINVMKAMDYLGCHFLKSYKSTFKELMNQIRIGKKWNLCLVNTMKFKVTRLKMSLLL